MAAPSTNLTHAECRARAASLTVASYRIELDLSRAADPDAATFPSRSTVLFTAFTGGPTWIDLIADRVTAARLDGRELDVTGYDGARLAVPAADGPHELVVEAACRYSRTGRGAAPVRRSRRRCDLPLHPLRTHRRPPGVRELRATRSQGALHVRHHHTRRLAGPVRAGRGGADGRRRRGDRVVPPDTAAVHLPDRGRRRAVPPGHRCLAGRAARGAVPGVDGRVPRPRGDLHRHAAGPGLLRQRVRAPLPLGQVRLDLRARVQPRRDGEPGPGHLHRGLHPPGRGDAGGPGTPGRGDPARDGAHVVRRPGDPALVGRHLAQGVVRRPDGLPRHRGGHRVRRRVDDVRDPAQGLGLPRRPAAHHAPDRRDRGRPGGGAAELRRHHLRQGRVGAQAADGLRRRGRVLRGCPRLLRPARLQQHGADRPAGVPRAVVGPRPAGLVAGVAGDGGDVPSRSGGRDRPGRSARAARGDPGRNGPGDRRTRRPPAPRGDRPLRVG